MFEFLSNELIANIHCWGNEFLMKIYIIEFFFISRTRTSRVRLQVNLFSEYSIKNSLI